VTVARRPRRHATGSAPPRAPAGPPDEVPRFSVEHMDRSTGPSEDFYRFAAGRWVDTHPVPADKSRWSGFDELRERNFQLLRGLLERASDSPRGAADASRRKVGDFFAAATDLPLRAKRGARPIARDLGSIGSAPSLGPLLGVLARFHRVGVPGLFATEVAPDEKNSSVYAFYLGQGGLSLPDRDYYLLDRFSELRAAYRLHVGTALALLGERSRAPRSAEAVLAIETALAQAGRSRVDLRDANKNYNRFTVEEIAERQPRLRWKEYLRRRGIRRVPYVVVGQPEFFDAVDGLLGSTSLRDWKAYLRWHLLHNSAPHLDPRFDDEDFEFFHRRLLGQQEPEPTWKRAATLVDSSLGEALGRLYVQRYFPTESRARMLDLVQDVRGVFRARLERVPWMTAETRTRALAKFDRFATRVGHPRRYRDYTKVRVSRRDHLGNLRRARAFEVERGVARIGSKVDRDEWQMTPPTVNAQFHPTKNEIFFPAGILQPPFFDPAMDDAVNFGGIAVVIGHEITHGYDDQGRKYDADGNLNDWWTAADAREFQERAQRIVAQYSRFQPLPGLPLNGELTMGENIADLGGVSIAYEALTRRLEDGRTPDVIIDGFTPQQRFFLSYGQIWRGNVRDEEMRRRIATDPHSPGRFRVNGVLANLSEFWKAFDVPEGSPMRQDEGRRVSIW
jgi:putative endopeptidase